MAPSTCFTQRKLLAYQSNKRLHTVNIPASLLPVNRPHLRNSRSQCLDISVSASAVMAPRQALKTYKASEMSATDLQEATARPRIDFASILGTVCNGIANREHASYWLQCQRMMKRLVRAVVFITLHSISSPKQGSCTTGGTNCAKRAAAGRCCGQGADAEVRSCRPGHSLHTHRGALRLQCCFEPCRGLFVCLHWVA